MLEAPQFLLARASGGVTLPLLSVQSCSLLRPTFWLFLSHFYFSFFFFPWNIISMEYNVRSRGAWPVLKIET